MRSDSIPVWIIKRRLNTYLSETTIPQPEPSFLNENGPIKPTRLTTITNSPSSFELKAHADGIIAAADSWAPMVVINPKE